MENIIIHSNQPKIISKLRDLLGQDVLLLAWPTRSKGTQKKWGHLELPPEAKWFWDTMQRKDWFWQCMKVRDWKALAFSFNHNNYFESQR